MDSGEGTVARRRRTLVEDLFVSYRTYINGTQIFGNNEYYPEWIEFIKSQGIEVDEDDGFYNGEITDFMGALETIEKIVMRLEREFQERKKLASRLSDKNKPISSLFDFSNIAKELEEQDEQCSFNDSLFDKLLYYTRNGYAFMPYSFYMACIDKLETSDDKTKGHFHCYKLKDGEKINVSAG